MFGIFCCEVHIRDWGKTELCCTSKTFSSMVRAQTAGEKKQLGITKQGLTNILSVLQSVLQPGENALDLVKYGFQHCFDLGTLGEVLGTGMCLILTTNWSEDINLSLAVVNGLLQSVKWPLAAGGSTFSSLSADLIQREASSDGVDQWFLRTRKSQEKVSACTALHTIIVFFTCFVLPAAAEKNPGIAASHQANILRVVCLLFDQAMKIAQLAYDRKTASSHETVWCNLVKQHCKTAFSLGIKPTAKWHLLFCEHNFRKQLMCSGGTFFACFDCCSFLFTRLQCFPTAARNISKQKTSR